MMKKLDPRTMLVALLIFALGYGLCLAMPVAQADVNDPVIIDRLVVNDSISGPGSIAMGGTITSGGLIEGNSNVNIAGDYKISGTTIIDSSRRLKGVTIELSVTGGSGLDVGKLQGYSANDFVLKGDIGDDFCRAFCPIILKPR